MASREIDLCTRRRVSPDPESLALLPAETQEFAHIAASTSLPVLLFGETGSGKTHLARLIHQLGPRARQPYIAVNCSRGDTLFESEMFGHIKGAFTGADRDHPGLFEAASEGTVLLDEIGELPSSLQPKLLRVLGEKVIRRLGATKETPVDVRIIAATNRNLRQMLGRSEFREDLFYRLASLKYRVLPLRERKDQLPEIARYLFEKLIREGALPGPIPEIHPQALLTLQDYDWPGNFRELEQVLGYTAIFFPGPVIRPEHVHAALAEAVQPDLLTDEGSRKQKQRYAAPQCPEEERRLIIEALEAEDGNRTRAAKRLGMSRATFYTKLYRYSLAANPFGGH